MTIYVIKRDGTQDDFEAGRILSAVSKAAVEIFGDDEYKVDSLATEVYENAAPIIESLADELDGSVTVKDIEAVVENVLMQTNQEVARAYIEYRHDKDNARELNSDLHSAVMGLINSTDKEVLDENANKDSNEIHTRRDLLAGIIAKHYAFKHILPSVVSKAHIEGDIHFHDADYSPMFPQANCCLVDFECLWKNGFHMGGAYLEAPKHVASATAQIAQIVAKVASSNFGGTTIPHLDQLLEPFIKMDEARFEREVIKYGISDPDRYVTDKLTKIVYDAMQSLEYEINTLHTTNGQTPFVTVSFGSGKSQYSKMVVKAILENRLAGLGKNHVTPIFPKLVYHVTTGHNKNPKDPHYDMKLLAIKCISERMYPDILSGDVLEGWETPLPAPMGCRSFLAPWQNEKGEFVYIGRNNLGVVTINLPRIAIKAGGDLDLFFQLLDEQLNVCYTALMARIETFKGVKAKIAPLLYCEGAFGVNMDPEDEILELFKNGRSSISLGYIGFNEMANAMYQDEPHAFDSSVKQAFMLDVIKHLADKCSEWKDKTGFGFSLYGTPAENLCYRFLKLDRERFGVIEGVTDKDYYTNSFHLDVNKKVSVYDKYAFEAPYHKYSAGGNISYAEYPNMGRNLKGLERAIDYALTQVPYLGTNTPIDHCVCGWSGESLCTSKGFECPECGNHDPKTLNVTRRVCGYLGNPAERPFNGGKLDELTHRTKHTEGEQ